MGCDHLACDASIARKIADRVARHSDGDVSGLETPGTFTALLEACRAPEIAADGDADTTAERAQDAADYHQSVLRNQQ